MSPSSTADVVYGGQHDSKYMTFDLLLHAAFVADQICGDMLEPARVVCVEGENQFMSRITIV